MIYVEIVHNQLRWKSINMYQPMHIHECTHRFIHAPILAYIHACTPTNAHSQYSSMCTCKYLHDEQCMYSLWIGHAHHRLVWLTESAAGWTHSEIDEISILAIPQPAQALQVPPQPMLRHHPGGARHLRIRLCFPISNSITTICLWVTCLLMSFVWLSRCRTFEDKTDAKNLWANQ